MQSSDTVDNPVVGQSDYPLKVDELVTTLNKLVTEIVAAQGDANTIAEALAGFVKASGLTSDLDAGGNEITNAKNASTPSSLVTLQQLTALVQAGSSDLSTIAVTALAIGSLANGELLRNVDGNLVGFDPSNLITATALAQEVSLLDQRDVELESKVEEVEALALLGI